MEATDNYRKHTTKSFIQRMLIDNYYDTLLNVLKELEVNSVLDVGCGEGFTLHKLKLAKIGRTHEGIDFLQKSIDIGKKVHPNLTFKRGDIYELPYKNDSFDLVICTEVLEHLETPEAALKELVRVTKKYCLLSVPHEPFFQGGNFLRGKNLSRWGNDIEHIQHWSSGGFEKFVKKGDLKIIKKKLPLPWTMILGKKITS